MTTQRLMMCSVIRKLAAGRFSLLAICRNCLYLLLILWIVSEAAVRYGLKSSDVLAPVPLLDSFFEPAIAAALLKRQAEQSFSAFNEIRNDADYPINPEQQAGTPVPKHASTGATPDAYASSESLSREAVPVQRLENLSLTSRELREDIEQKLLVVYLREHSADKLVDSFLDLLRSSPQRAEVLEWVGSALDSAKSCGRTEEVEDALEHVIKFHGRLATASGLKQRLERWKALTNSAQSGLSPDDWKIELLPIVEPALRVAPLNRR